MGLAGTQSSNNLTIVPLPQQFSTHLTHSILMNHSAHTAKHFISGEATCFYQYWIRGAVDFCQRKGIYLIKATFLVVLCGPVSCWTIVPMPVNVILNPSYSHKIILHSCFWRFLFQVLAELSKSFHFLCNSLQCLMYQVALH